MRPNTKDDFWSHVKIGASDECWPWLLSCFKDGYGSASYGNKTHRAHRLAWDFSKGPIPKGKSVLHKCDNRPCCNPSHFFLGTTTDNMQDMLSKGRGNKSKGEQVASAKLTEDDVIDIRKSDLGSYALAKKYGVDYRNIWLIRVRKTWRHLP